MTGVNLVRGFESLPLRSKQAAKPAASGCADVAIVGAPMDDLVSDRPDARMAQRAIRAASVPPGPHLEAKIDALAELRVLDFGDAP